jgi:hypothetical protein
MATKAVCVLKGDGSVQGTVHFEQKARPGAEACGEAAPAGRTPVREAGCVGSRAALATPPPRGRWVRAAPGLGARYKC